MPPPKTNTARDLERLARENAQLRREIARLEVYRAMAYRDPLTGLWNRRYFEDRLQEELSRSRRAGPQRRFSLMAIDLDDFKAVNDAHGHAGGDAVLKEVGEFLIAHLRNHDIACRTGGDEFTVILPDLSASDCGGLVERLQAARTVDQPDGRHPRHAQHRDRQLARGRRFDGRASGPGRPGDVRGQTPAEGQRG